MVALISGNRCARRLVERSVNRAGVISLLLQFDLHIRDDLIGQQVAVGVDRSVVIVGVSRVVAPSRIPEVVVPIVISAAEKDDA